MTEVTITTETRGKVGIITLNRPKALNALNGQLITEMNAALDRFDTDSDIGCIILTGSEKAFAAGADIREMKDKTFAEVTQEDFLWDWDHIGTIRKPIIAAVAGYCLGGGFEFALAADFIIAAENAKFALPEVTLGIIPGGGGTQRLARTVGKAKAMEMILTGRMMDVTEAERLGIVARVVPVEKLMDEALASASKIASLSQPVMASAKRVVNAAFNTPLGEGLAFERKSIHALFNLEDQKEGMTAFLEKRPAVFRNR
ncbi:MAG: enoyl-CoA hydratase [Phyllobacteriaceae bacterium]|nr:enoyl-CoA hydratase [Phyllobacteriaceae bacterium]